MALGPGESIHGVGPKDLPTPSLRLIAAVLMLDRKVKILADAYTPGKIFSPRNELCFMCVCYGTTSSVQHCILINISSYPCDLRIRRRIAYEVPCSLLTPPFHIYSRYNISQWASNPDTRSPERTIPASEGNTRTP